MEKEVAEEKGEQGKEGERGERREGLRRQGKGGKKLESNKKGDKHRLALGRKADSKSSKEQATTPSLRI